MLKLHVLTSSFHQLQEWVCLLCQKQRQTQQQELRDAGPPPETVETEDRLLEAEAVDTPHDQVRDTGQAVPQEQEKPYTTQHDLQIKTGANYPRLPVAEPLHDVSPAEEKTPQEDMQEDIRGAGEPRPQQASDRYAAQQDLHTSNAWYEGEAEKRGAEASYSTQREQLEIDTLYESSEPTYSRDLYSGSSRSRDGTLADARYSRSAEPDGEVRGISNGNVLS